MDVLSSRILLRPSDLDRSRRFYRDVLGLAIYREFGPPDDPGVVHALPARPRRVLGQPHRRPDGATPVVPVLLPGPRPGPPSRQAVRSSIPSIARIRPGQANRGSRYPPYRSATSGQLARRQGGCDGRGAQPGNSPIHPGRPRFQRRPWTLSFSGQNGTAMNHPNPTERQARGRQPTAGSQRPGGAPAPGTPATTSPAPGPADLTHRRQLAKSVSWSSSV